MSLISREPEINNINWPIYSLANYENSGVLLDRCRSSFDAFACSPTTTAAINGEHLKRDTIPMDCFSTNNNNQLTTSDYLTGEESSMGDVKQATRSKQQGYQSDGCEEKSKFSSKKQSRRCKLLWWQLIESSSQQETERKRSELVAPTSNWLVDDCEQKQQLLHLCFSLHKAVSAFLIGSPIDGKYDGSPKGSWRFKGGSRSLQQPIERSIDATTHQNISRRHRPPLEGSPGTQSVNTGEDLSQANIRRLSWRRKVLEKGPKRSQADNEEGNERMTPQVALLQRRLASFGQTYSLNDNNSSYHKDQPYNDNIGAERDKLSSSKNKKVTNLEKFIQANHDLDKLRRNFSASKWSKLSAKRGKYGESLVHILIINHSNEHLILLICLLHLYPLLASDIFESKKFKGVSLLHLSIAYSNEKLLRYLMDINKNNNNNNNNNLKASKFQVSGSLFRSPIKSLSWTTSQSSPSSFGSSYSSSPSRSFTSGPPSTGNKRQRERQQQKKLQQQQQLATNLREEAKLTWLGMLIRRFDKVSSMGDNLMIASGKVAAASSNAYWCDQMDHWPTANGHAHLILFDRVLAKSPESVQNKADSCDSRLPIYLGDTPLAWTISFRARTMYEILVDEYKIDQDSQDAEGNTCLHLLVINNQTGWARFLIKSGANRNLVNLDNLTPLLFACHLGRFEIFHELLELSAVEFWSYSMIRCCGYPLTSLDSILILNDTKDGGQKRSAMSVILESRESDNEQKSLLLSSAVVKKLLEEKWRIFARRLFYHELLLSLAHLMLMTLSISLRPIQHSNRTILQVTSLSNGSESLGIEVKGKEEEEEDVNTDLQQGLLSLFNQIILLQDRQQIIRHLSELTTVLLSALQLIRFADEWRRYGNVALQWTYNPLLPNFISANLLIVTCASLRVVGALNYVMTGKNLTNLGRIEDVLLIFAAPLLWSSLLFFIAYMIVRDLRQFSVIYLVFLYSFAQCIFFVNHKPQRQETILPNSLNSTANSTLLQDVPINNADAKHWLLQITASYFELCMDLFKMTLGVYDLQPYRHSTLARLFFLLFIYLIPILFNMLIAMMNNTYSLIISQSERAWSFQWARTLFALERRLSEKEKSAYLRLYSINIPAPNQQVSTSSVDLNTDESTHVSSKAGTETESEQSNKRFVPALMIIKRMSCTRAERHRLIVGYWQRSIRSIMSQVKKKVGPPSRDSTIKF